jgi:hypothetical protein
MLSSTSSSSLYLGACTGACSLDSNPQAWCCLFSAVSTCPPPSSLCHFKFLCGSGHLDLLLL